MNQKFDPTKATIAEIVHRIKTTYHTSNRELAALIGRSEKLIRNLHHGKTPGENYRRTLIELYNDGTITHQRGQAHPHPHQSRSKSPLHHTHRHPRHPPRQKTPSTLQAHHPTTS